MLRSEEANEGLSNNVNNPTKHTLYWILLPNSQDCHFLKISIPRRIQILFSIKKGQWHLTMLPSEDADEGLSNNMNDATKHILQYIIANGWSLSLFKDPNLWRIQITNQLTQQCCSVQAQSPIWTVSLRKWNIPLSNLSSPDWLKSGPGLLQLISYEIIGQQ